jgi:hypothetical protein
VDVEVPSALDGFQGVIDDWWNSVQVFSSCRKGLLVRRRTWSFCSFDGGVM